MPNVTVEDMVAHHSTGAFGIQDYKHSSILGFAVINENSKLSNVQLNSGICHASVRPYVTKNTIGILNKSDASFANNPGAVIFADWLINRSAVRNVFLVKDPVLSLRYGFLTTPKVSGPEFLCASQLCRLTTAEYPSQFEAACAALSYAPKLHPLFIFYLAFQNYWKVDKDVIKASYRGMLNQTHSHHLPFKHIPRDSNDVEAQVLRLMDDTPPTKEVLVAKWGTAETYQDRGGWGNYTDDLFFLKSRVDPKHPTSLTAAQRAALNSDRAVPFNKPKQEEKVYVSPWPKATELFRNFAAPVNTKKSSAYNISTGSYRVDLEAIAKEFSV